MNGVAEINITKGNFKGVYKLRFGMIGCMEFEVRCFNSSTLNNGKMLTDLIFAGIFGEAARVENKMPVYSDVADLVDSLSEEEDYNEQLESIWNVYNQSKWGSEFQKKIDELSKKKEQSEMLSA